LACRSLRLFVTGSAGLVGSEVCKLFAEKGWSIIGVDNYMRGKIFGKEGDTARIMKFMSVRRLTLQRGLRLEQQELRVGGAEQ